MHRLPRTLVCLQGALAMLMGMQAIVVASIIMWLDTEMGHVHAGRFSIVRIAVRHGDDSLPNASVHWYLGIDARYIILVCLSLGSFMQGIALVAHEGQWARPLRWIEGSGCMPATAMAVALEAGVRDVYALQCIFGLVWVTQVLCVCAHVCMDLILAIPQHGDHSYAWCLPHGAMWLCLCMAYGPILNALGQNNNTTADALWLVVGQFLIGLSLSGLQAWGLVQCARLPRQLTLLFTDDEDASRTRAERIWLQCDHGAVVLGFVSQTLLCWSVLGPVLA